MNILVIEDNDVDVEQITRCLINAELPNPLHCASDGEEALERLRGVNGKQLIDRPCLILLDLNLPRMNGFEFLGQIRVEPDLSDTPVLVLTTSDRDEDIQESLRLGAVDYVTKPISCEKLAKLIVSFDAQQHARVVDERTYTVVVVDQEQAVRDRAITSAMGTGWGASTFSTAAESLEQVRLRAPDVLIVGERIGATSGVELLELFAALPNVKHTRFYLAADSVMSDAELQRIDDLGASRTGPRILSNSTVFREFLENRPS